MTGSWRDRIMGGLAGGLQLLRTGESLRGGIQARLLFMILSGHDSVGSSSPGFPKRDPDPALRSDAIMRKENCWASNSHFARFEASLVRAPGLQPLQKRLL